MRLIDADAYPCAKCGSAYCITNCDKYWEWFNSTVDAEPVKHGRWILYIYSYGLPRCSCCGWCIPYSEDSTLDARNYCPNCGAMMDLEVQRV